MEEKVILALIAAAAGFLGALLERWLERRGKLDEGLLEKRTELYKELWLMTGRLPLYPWNTKFSGNDAGKLMQDLRNWYFDQAGGLYMSTKTQRLYLDFQDSLNAVADKASDPIGEGAYANVRKSGSSLRSGMTRDLSSRERIFAFG